MKKSFRRKLEKKLPYPVLTDWADSRFDAILNGLPEKSPAQTAAAPKRRPAHFAKMEKRGAEEEAPKVVYFEEPPKYHRVSNALKFAASAAAFCLVCAGFLWLMKNGWGDAPIEASSGLAPASAVTSELPHVPADSPCEISITGSTRLGRCLFLDLALTPHGDVLSRAAWLSTAWDGEETMMAAVNGRTAAPYSDVLFRRDGNVFTGRAILFLDDLTVGALSDRAEVALEFPLLRGMAQGSEFIPLIDPDITLQTDLKVIQTVSAAQPAHIAAEQEECLARDNGICLKEVSVIPGQVDVYLTVPAELTALDLSASTQYDYSLMRLGTDVAEPGNGRQTFHFAFEALPEGTEQLVFTATVDYDFGSVYAFLTTVYLAEFTVELREGEVLSCAVTNVHRWWNDQPKTDIAEYLSALETGFNFGRSHVLTERVGALGFPDGEEADGRWALYQFCFWSDVDNDLPLEADFLADGESYVKFPVYRTEDCRDRGPDARSQLFWESDGVFGMYCTDKADPAAGRTWDLSVYRMNGGAQNGSQRRFARAYQINVYVPAEWAEAGSGEEKVCGLILRNTRTGMVWNFNKRYDHSWTFDDWQTAMRQEAFEAIGAPLDLPLSETSPAPDGEEAFFDGVGVPAASPVPQWEEGIFTDEEILPNDLTDGEYEDYEE